MPRPRSQWRGSGGHADTVSLRIELPVSPGVVVPVVGMLVLEDVGALQYPPVPGFLFARDDGWGRTHDVDEPFPPKDVFLHPLSPSDCVPMLPALSGQTPDSAVSPFHREYPQRRRHRQLTCDLADTCTVGGVVTSLMRREAKGESIVDLPRTTTCWPTSTPLPGPAAVETIVASTFTQNTQRVWLRTPLRE